ncbi:MAG: ABC transporter ATP-binding protein [Deltaproteobacteria bacterium]|nr:MAG: ABC transporter ATP-binding protein [Deltaproteobacteria bacterium]
MNDTADPLVRLESISKTFGRVKANRDITLHIRAGKVKALLGENGAGKSTLMSILSGRLKPDSGRIIIKGIPQKGYSTKTAIQTGIGMVYQHFMLVEAMTVTENIFLGRKERFLLKSKEMIAKVDELIKTYGLQIDPVSKISDLSMGERQRVEILKLLYRQSRILILDEPTAVLTPREIEQLFDAVRAMAAQGKAIVFISHKLEEVMAIADEIAILRKGSVVDEMPAESVQSKAELAKRMVGREVLLKVDREPLEPRQVVLRVRGLRDSVLDDISFDLRQGEILGVVGVAGNGQKRLVEVVSGLEPPQEGEIRILGEQWIRFFSKKRWDASLSYIPEDRIGVASCMGLDLVDNFLLTTREGFSSGPWLKRAEAEKKLKELIEKFGIKAPSSRVTARQLSGGNLQKMVLAREFFRRPRLIVAEQPTQGLDIGATEDVWRILLKARERAGILLITGDLREAMTLSDRIGVMFGGRLMDLFPVSDEEKMEKIGPLMAGIET